MSDKHPMTDAELQKLLREIDVPAPDENEKLSTLNLAESQFAQNVQKNENNRQGNGLGNRLMNVTHNAFILLTGGKNMKKSYAIASVLAIGVAGIALVQYQPMSELTAVSDGLISAEQKQTDAETTTPNRHIEAVKPRMESDIALPTPTPTATISKREMNRSMDFAAGAPASIMSAPAMVAHDMQQVAPEYFGRDKFEEIKENPVKLVTEEPVSTFSIDVDTTSYAVMRRALNNGYLPPKDAVRIEELINYFDYDYAVPESRNEPFKPTVALYDAPWNPDKVLMHVGIKGHELPADAQKPHSNLVFLLDTSGSMNSADKLPLLQQAFRMLVDTLGADDTISIVTYAGSAGVVLEPTKVSDKQAILNAIDNLRAAGGTAGAEGIRTAYELAEAKFDKDGVNRVILATDGDFNVGITDQNQLKDFIERKRDSGIYLSVLGFGQGNYNDAIMQTLAQNGNGNAAYIDSINEARKVLVDEATSTLYPIANDVKIQVEFNPLKVAEYRLIGYETRQLNREDFNNDKVDAGDIGAGHTVTAIYELTPAGSKAQLIDDLRYGQQNLETQAKTAGEGESNEYAFLKMRYKLPGEQESTLITRPITDADYKPLASEKDDIRFAAAVAGFGQLIRGESYVQDFGYDNVIELANGARGADPFNYRGEFVNLVRNAKVAQDQQRQPQNGHFPHR
jgi:Ca-activated chloride channel homolog